MQQCKYLLRPYIFIEKEGLSMKIDKDDLINKIILVILFSLMFVGDIILIYLAYFDWIYFRKKIHIHTRVGRRRQWFPSCVVNGLL